MAERQLSDSDLSGACASQPNTKPSFTCTDDDYDDLPSMAVVTASARKSRGLPLSSKRQREKDEEEEGGVGGDTHASSSTYTSTNDAHDSAPSFSSSPSSFMSPPSARRHGRAGRASDAASASAVKKGGVAEQHIVGPSTVGAGSDETLDSQAEACSFGGSSSQPFVTPSIGGLPSVTPNRTTTLAVAVAVDGASSPTRFATPSVVVAGGVRAGSRGGGGAASPEFSSLSRSQRQDKQATVEGGGVTIALGGADAKGRADAPGAVVGAVSSSNNGFIDHSNSDADDFASPKNVGTRRAVALNKSHAAAAGLRTPTLTPMPTPTLASVLVDADGYAVPCTPAANVIALTQTPATAKAEVFSTAAAHNNNTNNNNKHNEGNTAAGVLLAAATATPSNAVLSTDDLPTPQTVLTQLTQEAMLSQALYGSSSQGDPLATTQLSYHSSNGGASSSSSSSLSQRHGFGGVGALAAVSQPADDVTPLAAQLARVQQPMTVGREAHVVGDYAPPSPNVDLFADFGFTPLQSQTDVPQLRRRQHNGAAGRRSLSARADAGAGGGTALLADHSHSPRDAEGTAAERRRRGASAGMASAASTPRGSTAMNNNNSGGGGDGDGHGGEDASVALELSPISNTQRERRASERWCIMAKQFFDYIDQKPLKVVPAKGSDPTSGAAMRRK